MPAPEKRQKVFVIGFHKTGTTTMGLALDILGYRVTGPDLDLAEAVAKGDWSAIEPRLEAFDAFQDSPWYLLYEGLHARYPDARFILTTRPPERWLASVKDHFGHRMTPMRRHIYGDRRSSGTRRTTRPSTARTTRRCASTSRGIPGSSRSISTRG